RLFTDLLEGVIYPSSQVDGIDRSRLANPRKQDVVLPRIGKEIPWPRLAQHVYHAIPLSQVVVSRHEQLSLVPGHQESPCHSKYGIDPGHGASPHQGSRQHFHLAAAVGLPGVQHAVATCREEPLAIVIESEQTRSHQAASAKAEGEPDRFRVAAPLA